MSSIANIVAFDGASTPVSHTLIPDSVTREKDEVTAVWVEKLAGIPDIAQVRCTIKRKKLGSGVSRVSIRTEVPVMESIGSQNAAGYTAAPKIAFIDTEESVFYAHERSTTTSRKICRQLHNNILANVSTSVTPSSAGPVHEAIDLLVMPT